MKLDPDWKHIVRKAWSMRLNALAFLFACAEVLLPLYMDAFPRNVFAVLSILALMGSMWARVINQKRYDE